MPLLDPFDPNSWGDDPPHEFRIYGDDNAQTWCVVDEEDYLWACRRRWHINEPHPGRAGKKRYFRSRAGWRKGGAEYLHVAIMKRTGIPPPGPEWTWTDHIDDDEFNCRRSNLQWATPATNNVHNKRKLLK